MDFANLTVRFSVKDGLLTVTEIECVGGGKNE